MLGLATAPVPGTSDARLGARRTRWVQREAAWHLGSWMAACNAKARLDVQELQEAPSLDDWSSVPFRRTAACGRAVIGENGGA